MRNAATFALAILWIFVSAGPAARASGATARAPQRVTEGYLQGSDGAKLFYMKIGQGKQAIVYLHGGPGANFRGQDTYIEPLAGPGRTVIFYDQRGSGLSEVITDPKKLDVNHHIDDLEAVRKHFHLERMTLIGLSWGAGLATLYAAEHPDRVERMLLISPMEPASAYQSERDTRAAAVTPPGLIEHERQLIAAMANASDAEARRICRDLIAITFKYQYVAVPTPDKIRQAARRCDIPPAAIRNRWTVSKAIYGPNGSLRSWDFRPIIRRLTMPVLVVEGQDTNVPLDATRAWAANFPNGRLLLIPGAGHELFLDQPQAFERAASQFISGSFPAAARSEVEDRVGR